MAVKLNSMMRAWQSRDWWFRTIAANNPDATVIALEQVGVSLPNEVTLEQILQGIEVAKADGQSEALFARLKNVAVDWNSLTGAFKVSLGAYMQQLADNSGKQMLVAGNGTNENSGGFDWGDMDMWGEIHDAIFNGVSTIVGGKPATQPAPAPDTVQEGNNTGFDWTNHIGVIAVALGLLGVAIAIAVSGTKKRSEK